MTVSCVRALLFYLDAVLYSHTTWAWVLTSVGVLAWFVKSTASLFLQTSHVNSDQLTILDHKSPPNLVKQLFVTWLLHFGMDYVSM